MLLGPDDGRLPGRRVTARPLRLAVSPTSGLWIVDLASARYCRALPPRLLCAGVCGLRLRRPVSAPRILRLRSTLQPLGSARRISFRAIAVTPRCAPAHELTSDQGSQHMRDHPYAPRDALPRESLPAACPHPRR